MLENISDMLLQYQQNKEEVMFNIWQTVLKLSDI